MRRVILKHFCSNTFSSIISQKVLSLISAFLFPPPSCELFCMPRCSLTSYMEVFSRHHDRASLPLTEQYGQGAYSRSVVRVKSLLHNQKTFDMLHSYIDYSSFVYADFCLQAPPNRYTSKGTGASTAQHAARIVKPQPYPIASVSGAVANGKNVPIRHLEISTAVKLDAEYNPKASTT